MSHAKWRLAVVVMVAVFFSWSEGPYAFGARDPGVRGGPAGAGVPFANLTADELRMFNEGRLDFQSEEEVDEGVGPRFNFVGCAGCHAQPDVGGTSPAANPLFRVTADLRFTGNVVP